MCSWHCEFLLLAIRIRYPRKRVNSKVEGVRPKVESAALNGTALTVTFDETLGAAAALANEAFAVRKTLHNGTRVGAALGGSPSISGATLTLTLTEAAVATDKSVTVSYARPATGANNRLVDALGNEADSFTDQAVANNTPPATAPCAASSSASVGLEARAHPAHDASAGSTGGADGERRVHQEPVGELDRTGRPGLGIRDRRLRPALLRRDVGPGER